ncbi:MAG: hypothetical protein DMG42_09070 [Acidobacteria bacterium]|nr:MAG: hypothetical protein DMG42_09070 [Acidobacteriota bacterium]
MSAADPIRDGEPVRVILRLELPATRVECVSTSFRRERVYQKQAGKRITGSDEPGYRQKVPPRLFLGPLLDAIRQALKVKNPVRIRVTSVTPSVPGALLQENRFDLRFEKVEIEDVFRRGNRFLELVRICRLRLLRFICVASVGQHVHGGMQACHSGNH